MKRKFLEELGLEKEVIDKIMAENGNDITAAKNGVETLKSENEKLKNDIQDRDSQLESLQNSTGDITALKEQITTLQTENKAKDEAHAEEMNRIIIDAALDLEVANRNGVNGKAIKALINMEKITIDKDGKISGHTEQFDELVKAEDSKVLFKTEKQTIKGAQAGGSGKEEPDGKVDFDKMTYSEIAAYMAENPDAQIE